MSTRLCLVTGASGYVGGRLLRELEARGERVRCLARRPGFLEPRVAPGTQVVRGDALEPESLGAAMAGVEVAYYLIHSMGSGGDFESEDRRAAFSFAAALYLALPCTLFGYAAWIWALKRLPAGDVAAFVFLNPPLATLWAWLFEGQPIRPPFVIGALVLLAGVAAIVLPQSRRREKESSI